MSLPGLGLDEPEEVQTIETSQHDLAKENEWRFEVAVGKYVQVKLLSGDAELFGTELVPGNTYTFTGVKAAIYTWNGCSFEVSGDALQSEYTAEETPMSEYINVHFALETLRERAKASGNGREGPRVLILGPDNAGKTTLAKILTGYSNRSARSPVVVNLDVKEGVLSIPGTLTATVFKTMMDVEEGWGTAPMSGPNGAIPVKLPLVYFFGSSRPEEKGGAVYKAQLRRLALSVTGRLAQDAEARESGLIIDTPGSLTSAKEGHEIIQDIVSELAVSAIICLGSERLYSDMVKRFDGQPIVSRSSGSSINNGGAPPGTISVIKLPKSGGCVDRDEAYMQAFRAAQIKAYFYGNPRLSSGISLQPRQQQVDFSTLSVWRRVSSTPDPTSSSSAFNDEDDETFLPGGINDDTSTSPGGVGGASSKVPLPASQIYERVSAPFAAMRNAILAVMNCDPEAEQEVIRDSSVMGFLYVTDTDEARGRISLLSPVAGRVPSRAIVWAGWPEPVLGMDRS
ncbi:mRNA cleavage and polyadenylation factor IA/II complex, partial [Aureobasidium melanogenum]